jgi:hypothetical protein
VEIANQKFKFNCSEPNLHLAMHVSLYILHIYECSQKYINDESMRFLNKPNLISIHKNTFKYKIYALKILKNCMNI